MGRINDTDYKEYTKETPVNEEEKAVMNVKEIDF
jgi:hypothetical protein